MAFGLLAVGATAANLQGPTWAELDPYCNTFNTEGTKCLKCSYHYFMGSNGKCQAVSDWCKTWDDKTGCCTSCFDGYGAPVDGKCGPDVGTGGNNGGGHGGNGGGHDDSDDDDSGIDVGGGDDDEDVDHCAVYKYYNGSKWLDAW